MSRIANNPVSIPKGVEISLAGQDLSVKGGKGVLSMRLHDRVLVNQEENMLKFSARDAEKQSLALAGTTRSIVNNMVLGVSNGWQKKLLLQGVGYRAQAQGKKLTLQLGFSHPVEYQLPEGVQAETPSQTEVIISGMDKQLVGQVSAEIRSFRPPEPYKGKGVRYADEYVRRKEAKKK
jgi:large subunit ribosomal protein L6